MTAGFNRLGSYLRTDYGINKVCQTFVAILIITFISGYCKNFRVPQFTDFRLVYAEFLSVAVMAVNACQIVCHLFGVVFRRCEVVYSAFVAALYLLAIPLTIWHIAEKGAFLIPIAILIGVQSSLFIRYSMAVNKVPSLTQDPIRFRRCSFTQPVFVSVSHKALSADTSTADQSSSIDGNGSSPHPKKFTNPIVMAPLPLSSTYPMF